MKIAILTQPLRTNYGGILQAYAFQTILQRRGHNVVVINREWADYPSLKLFVLRLLSIAKCVINRYIYGKKEYIIMSPCSPFYHVKWNGYNVMPFVKQYINQSRMLRNSKELRKYLYKENFDAIIVGSDQVWRPAYTSSITDYFLKEVPKNSDTLKISYAASFGTDNWEFSEVETIICKELLKEFDAVSVRESSGVQLCNKYFDVNAIHVLDPTMLLKEDDYIALMNKSIDYIHEGDMFCYILDQSPEIDKIIESLKTEGYSPYFANCDAEPTEDDLYPYQVSVEQWIRGFYDAKIILTDSFHACVFSILFKKPFIVVGNKCRGMSRFNSLLSMFDLSNRLVFSYDDFEQRKVELLTALNYANIEEIMSHWKKKSMLFLSDSGI